MSLDDKKPRPQSRPEAPKAPGNRQELPPTSGISFLDQQVNAKRMTGLPPAVQAKMEGHFQQDLSHLQVKPNSSEATQLQAKAFARGHEVHFAPGEYRPDTAEGQRLIGHEVAHTVQQQKGQVKPTTAVDGKPINDQPALEAAADREGAAAAQHTPIQRQTTPEAGEDQAAEKSAPAYSPLPIDHFTLTPGTAPPAQLMQGGRMMEHKRLLRGNPSSPTYQLYHGGNFIQTQVVQGGTTYVTQMAGWRDWIPSGKSLANYATVALLFTEAGLTIANGYYQLQTAKDDDASDLQVASAYTTMGIGFSKAGRGLAVLVAQLTGGNAKEKWYIKLADLARMLEGVASIFSGGVGYAADKAWEGLAFGIVKTIRSLGRIADRFKDLAWGKYLLNLLHYIESGLNFAIAFKKKNLLTGGVAGSKGLRATIDMYKDYKSNNPDQDPEPDLENQPANLETPLITEDAPQYGKETNV